MVQDAAVKALQACLDTYHRTDSVPRCLVAFSGGADSAALLFAAWKLQAAAKLRVIALHVHHHIRREEADRDAVFCRAFCEERQIPFHLCEVDAPAYAMQEKIGLEEAARHLRYAALEETAKREQIDWILTAHHQDDQAETVLMRLLRGTSPAGLSGIAPRRDWYLRPFLQLSKQSLLQYCAQQEIPFVEDSTNEISDCPRNYLRNEILPKLYAEYPKGAEAIARVAELLQQEEAYFASALAAYGSDPDRKTLQEMPLPLLRRFAVDRYYQSGGTMPLQFEHVMAMTDLILTGQTGKQVSLPGGLCARLSSDRWQIMRQTVPAAAAETVPLQPGWNEFSNGSALFLTNLQKEWEEMQNIYKLVIPMRMNSDRIVGTLYVRPRQSGDRCRCRGKNHTLKHLFQESKTDAVNRAQYYLVCDDEEILWIPGVALCDKMSASDGDLYLLYRFPDPQL